MRMWPNTWLRSAAAVGAVTLLVAACGGSGDDGQAEGDGTAAATTTDDAGSDTVADGEVATGSVQESIVVGINNPNYMSQAVVVQAIEAGYLEEEGISDVDILETDDYIAGLIGDSIDISQGDTDVIFGSALASGEDLVYLGTYRDGEGHLLAVREGITTADDLVGGTLTAGALGSRNYNLLHNILFNELGLDEEDVELMPQGGAYDAVLQAIISGTVDGGMVAPRHIHALEESGGRLLYNENKELPQEGIVVMGDYLAENRATVEAFLRATLRARQDLHAAIGDEAAQAEIYATMRDFGFDIPVEFEAVYDLEAGYVSTDGGFDPAQMDELIDEQIQLGNLPEDIDWREYVDLEPLHAAQEAVGVEIRPASLD